MIINNMTFKIYFTNKILLITKSHCSQSKFWLKIERITYITNPVSESKGMLCICGAIIAYNNIWITISVLINNLK